MATHTDVLELKIMNRGAWWATVHGVAKKSDMIEQLSNICILRADSCCCTEETNITLESNYPPIKKIKAISKNKTKRRASYLNLYPQHTTQCLAHRGFLLNTTLHCCRIGWLWTDHTTSLSPAVLTLEVNKITSGDWGEGDKRAQDVSLQINLRDGEKRESQGSLAISGNRAGVTVRAWYLEASILRTWHWSTVRSQVI